MKKYIHEEGWGSERWRHKAGERGWERTGSGEDYEGMKLCRGMEGLRLEMGMNMGGAGRRSLSKHAAG